MEREFWENCWSEGRIGFHMKEIHPYLKEFLHELSVVPGESVFVPLCGKSLDMLFLGQQGFNVHGVELSEAAVDAFFAENALPSAKKTHGEFIRVEGGPFRIDCGDFFALPAREVTARAVFDRGSLVAMPPEMRPDYAAKLSELLGAGSRVLLVSYDYDQSAMDGPPFSVSDAEIDLLFGDEFDVRPLCSREALEANAPLKERGLDRLVEKAHLLIRHP